MKIGIDISQIVYKGSGVASYTRNLAYSLLEYDSINSYVFFGSSLRRQQELLSFVMTLPKKRTTTTKIYSLPPRALDLLWNQIHVFGIERFIGQTDIFHTSDWTEPPSKSKKVTTIHDLVVFRYPEYLDRRIVQNQRRKLEWVARESSHIIADSENTKEDVVHYLRIPRNKISVVYLGIGKEYFPQKIDELKEIPQKFGIGNEYILCVGTREPRKNFERIINAFRALNEKDITLLIIGKIGWGKDLPSVSNVQTIEYVSSHDLAVLYSGAKCFVYPSLYEGFGLPVLEAFACGCPVVSSNKGSLSEIVGDKGVIVDPESEESITQGIERILNLTSLERKHIVEQGVRHAQNFTWKKTALETIAVYNSLI